MDETIRVTYTLTDAAKLMNLSRPTMQQLVNCDDFPAFKVGYRWIIDAEGLQRWLDAQVELKLQNSDEYTS